MLNYQRKPFIFPVLWAPIVALMLFCINVSAGCAAARAAETPGVPKYISIPIYFVTDREKTAEGYGNRRRYRTKCEHQMYYGTARVTVPNTHHIALDEKLKALGWQAQEKGAKICSKETISPEKPVDAKLAFLLRLTEALDREQAAQPDKNPPSLALFVHGAADAFEYCVQDAGTLAYNLQKPMVLYSWPSDPHLRGYFIDGTNIEWTQEHFQTFCRDLLDLKNTHPMDVICVSHSMGNRLAIRSLPVVYGKGLISDWEIISPDIDADTCRHYMMGYSQAKAKIRLYVSNKDLILPFTQMLNGGYYRLGEAASPIYEAKKNGKAEYLERIDFSVMDKGWHGHSLPFELVSNMVLKDKPPEGYHLVPEKEVHPNRLARFAGRSEDMSAVSSEADYCSRLVRNKGHK